LQSTWDEGSELSGRSAPTSGAGGGDTAADHRLKAHKAYMKWLQKHRVDSLGSNYDTNGKNNSMADMIMWLGLAMLMTGTVISFIGLGEKGFRTRHLRLLGPVLIGAGFSLCFIRVALCCCCCFTATSKSSLKSHQLLMEELHMEDVHMKERLAKAVHFHQAVAVKTTDVQFDLKIPAVQVDYESDVRGRLLDDAISERLSESVVDIDDVDREKNATTTAVIENFPDELILSANGLGDNLKFNLKVADLLSDRRHSSSSSSM